jgi:hypothetical protein
VYYEPPASRREQLSASALELARAASAPAALADAISARHVALWSAPHLDERLALAEDMIALGERSGNRERVLQGRNWRFMDLLESGDVTNAGASSNCTLPWPTSSGSPATSGGGRCGRRRSR